MASLEQRIEHLFPNKNHRETSPIAKVGLIFAERRGQWLTHDDVIYLTNKKFADSTVLNAFKELSRPLGVLGGHSFIDTEPVKKEGKGSSIVRGRLSEAATEKIFALVTPVEQKPESYFPGLLNGEGRLEMPPLQVGDKYLSPEDIILLRIQKSGEKETRHLLRKHVNDIPGAEKDAMQKMIDALAEQQGMTFDATNDRFHKGGKIEVPKGKLSEAHARWKRLPGKERPYAEAESKLDILKKHHFGRFPNRLYFFMDEALKDLASDENRVCLSMSTLVVDSREDYARVHAIEERALKGDQAAFGELIQTLSNDASMYARREAARSLGYLHDMRAVVPLIEAMMNDEYGDVRSIAATALGEFGYRQEFTMALKDSDYIVRSAIVTILGKMRDVRAVELLREALKDPDVYIQCAAVHALGDIGDKTAIDSLILMLDSDDEATRHAAVVALGNIEDRRAIQALRKACDDSSACVRDTAKKALEELEKRT